MRAFSREALSSRTYLVLERYVERAGPVAGFEAWLLVAVARPLPDPAAWLPSWEVAGYAGLTPSLLRRRLGALARSVT